MRDENELLTLAQAAAEFGVTHSRLRMAAWQGRLPTSKPGHDYLVRRGDVSRFLKASRRGRPPGGTPLGEQDAHSPAADSQP